MVLVYMDDLLITGNDYELILNTKKVLQHKFKIKDLGNLRYFLGIELARNRDGILKHQRKYCLELISYMGLSSSRPIEALNELNHKITTAEFDLHFPPTSNTDKLIEDPIKYQKLMGRLLY